MFALRSQQLQVIVLCYGGTKVCGCVSVLCGSAVAASTAQTGLFAGGVHAQMPLTGKMMGASVSLGLLGT